MKIAVSTMAFLGKPIEEIVEIAGVNNFNLEFSSSLPYHKDMVSIYLDAKVTRMLHNYFPAPEIPFVMNLASAIDEVRNTSLNHCKQGLELAKKSGSPFFSAHAGYCIDPKPDQLGKPLDLDATYNKEEHWEFFIPSVKELTSYAKNLGIEFLIENNVAASFNFNKEGHHPFLCSDVEDMVRIVNEVNDDSFGLLLDTAHHKVSANAIGFDKEATLESIRKHVKCIHHSDNEGSVDDNSPLPNDYWFLPYMKDYKDIWHVIEVKNIGSDQVQSQIDLLLKSVVY
jgi:sugar phosphate isomerase/epimerase